LHDLSADTLYELEIDPTEEMGKLYIKFNFNNRIRAMKETRRLSEVRWSLCFCGREIKFKDMQVDHYHPKHLTGWIRSPKMVDLYNYLLKLMIYQ
jgi:hypothetical protein